MGRKLVLKDTTITDTTAPVLLTLLARDTFTRADGAPGTAETGQAWTRLYGEAWTLAAGALNSPATIANASIGPKLGVDVKRTDMYVEALLGGAVWGIGVMARVTAAGAGYTLVHNANTVELWAGAETGGGTKLSTWSPGNPPATYTLALKVKGSSISAYRQGVLLGTVTDTTHTAGTWAGVRAQAANRTVDDFRATSAS